MLLCLLGRYFIGGTEVISNLETAMTWLSTRDLFVCTKVYLGYVASTQEHQNETNEKAVTGGTFGLSFLGNMLGLTGESTSESNTNSSSSTRFSQGSSTQLVVIRRELKPIWYVILKCLSVFTN